LKEQCIELSIILKWKIGYGQWDYYKHNNDSKFFIYQLMHKKIALKIMLKFTIKKFPTCFGAITTIGERVI